MGCQLELFQHLLESKKQAFEKSLSKRVLGASAPREADKQRNLMRLQILCRRCGSEMGLFSIVYLKDNELWVIGGWHWLELCLTYREIMQQKKQKREAESTQLDFLSVLGIAA